MMNILILTQYFWPESFLINDIAVGLIEKGCKVTVFTGKPNYPQGSFYEGYGFFKKSREFYKGIKIIRVPLIPRGKSGKIRLVINYVFFTLVSTLIAPIICKEQYDAQLVFEPSPIFIGIPAIVLKKIRKIPIFFWVQDLWPESVSATDTVKSSRIINFIGHLVRYIYSNCDKILIQSKAFTESIIKWGGAKDKIEYYPNSVEDYFTREIKQHESSLDLVSPDGFKIMTAGNIGKAQSFETLIKAAEIVKTKNDKIHWIIIGDGRMKSWVENEVENRGLSDVVHLIGRHPKNTMPYFFSLADVMLVSLKKDPIFALTIPSRVQSYLACGKPIIGSLDGEGARIVNEAQAGITCPTENPEALADIALRFYGMPVDDMKKMGCRGRAFFKKEFEREMLLERLNQMIRDFNKDKII
ncbi:MAG: glycosyltransferase family 4 protein [Candidatus Ancaeobacter aquaticus]|nr:glycosyltransferase family 4 protein [Candidatus Ancaeobacter aquaticus]